MSNTFDSHFPHRLNLTPPRLCQVYDHVAGSILCVFVQVFDRSSGVMVREFGGEEGEGRGGRGG